MPSIVQEISQKIKLWLRDPQWFTALVLALVAVTAFGLGRQSVGEGRTAASPAAVGSGMEADRPAPASSAPSDAEPLPSTYYVASKNGQVYHLPHCSGAKRINEANKITFTSKAAAEAAGYRPAANCKGI